MGLYNFGKASDSIMNGFAANVWWAVFFVHIHVGEKRAKLILNLNERLRGCLIKTGLMDGKGR